MQRTTFNTNSRKINKISGILQFSAKKKVKSKAALYQ